MRREQDRPAFIGHRANDRFQDVATHHRVKTGTRFVKQEQLGPVGQRYQETGFGKFTSGKLFDFGIWLQSELLSQFLCVTGVPTWIKRLHVSQQFVNPYPRWQIPVLREVADSA